MRVLLATGVFYPDVGGPAIHVFKIAERLATEGLEVQVLAYGDDPANIKLSFPVKRISRQYRKIWQWLTYFYTTLRLARQADLVYAFDPTAAGLPACLAAKFFRKPFIIRVGGDPIWEREAEMGKIFMPLATYYEKGFYRRDKPILYRLIKFVMNQASAVVLYNEFFKLFYIKYFDVDEQKIRIVKNPVSRQETALPFLSESPTIIFAGRFVKYKNLLLVIRAFKTVGEKIQGARLLLIGRGPEHKKLKKLVEDLRLETKVTFKEAMPQPELFAEIRKSALSLGPALSEFNPNFILESLSLGKPVLLSRGHGLSVALPERFLFNPLDQTDLEQKLFQLLDPEIYHQAVASVAALPLDQTWEKVTGFHLSLIQELGR